MSIPTSSVKEFIQFVKLCEQTMEVGRVLTIFSQEQCDRLVVVNTEQQPVGVVHLRRLMPHVIKFEQNHPEWNSQLDLEKPLSQLKIPLIEPVTILPADFSLSEFWVKFQQLQTNTEQEWAVVDTEGKFLGLLNIRLLLQSLVPTVENSTAQSHQTLANPSIKLLMQLLEQIPLPMKLQTNTGRVIALNSTWRQQIERLVESGEKKAIATVELTPPNSGKEFSTNNTTYQQQHYSQIDSNQKPFTTNSGFEPLLTEENSYYKTSGLTLSALPIPEKVEAYQETSINIENNILVTSANKEQDRVWQFVTIPLSGLELDKQENYQDLVLILAQDITEQQKFAKELALKNADLIQLNRLKDEFLACISHELKTPLTTVLGLSSLLKDQLLGQLNERQTRYAKLIHQSGRQLMTVVNDILDLTCMETGQMQLILEPVNVRNVCDRAYLQAVQLQSVKNEQADELSLKTSFVLDIEDNLEMFVADELRLRQMLVHLISNAIKFTEAQGKIGLQVSRWDGWIAFTIWDTGIGIPEEKQHLIFKKFQQLESPLTRRFEGTGLGLVLTQRLARMHGGDVSFVSKAGQGSQFTLLLPPIPPRKIVGTLNDIRIREEGEDNLLTFDSQFILPEYPTQPNQLVLIVETVSQYIEQLTHYLNGLGYRVMIARAGTEALEKARCFQPKVILLNPILPQLSGWDVLTLLKSDTQTKHIPVLITANLAHTELAYQNHADGFLSIPVQEDELRQSLSSLNQKPVKRCDRLTVLILTTAVKNAANEELQNLLINNSNSKLIYQVIEADDLEQADTLASIWSPDVLLLDSTNLTDPLSYIQRLSHYNSLASLPLITFDLQTTIAANQVSGISVFPCLVSTANHINNSGVLSEVIEVATRTQVKPRILVIDLSTSPNNSIFSNLDIQLQPSNEKSDFSLSSNSEIANSKDPQGWLYALIQYLQIAGFSSALSSSWVEVYQQLQNKSINLLMIHLGEVLPKKELIDSLKSLADICELPPILVLYHQIDKQIINRTTYDFKFTSQLELVLRAVATKILREPPQSMAELLTEINQLLAQKR